MTNETVDIVIIGAGAAGLATAIFAAEAARDADSTTAPRIVVVDGAKKIGAKILVSGGGRCNVTHDEVSPDDFNGPRNIVRNILAEFTERDAVAWFASMGVALKTEETGKLFPVSDDAHTVLNALLFRCDELGVRLRVGWRVADIRRGDDGVFEIVREGGCDDAVGEAPPPAPPRRGGESVLRARRVVMATGGRSLPKTGSDGGGWTIVQWLGHTVTPTYPALVPLVLDDAFFHAELSGVSHDAELSTYVDGKLADRRRGSLLWTHFGISGPLAMDASRHWVIAHEQGCAAELRCGFVPGGQFDEVDRTLVDAGRTDKRIAVGRAIMRVVPQLPRRVIESLCGHVGVDPAGATSQLPRDARRNLVHALIGLPLPVVRDRGWNYAEVTAGGVPLAEIDRRTMASRVVDGLHLVGEMLDCEGRIGGFNFQWAWSTGRLAGRAAVAALRERST